MGQRTFRNSSRSLIAIGVAAAAGAAALAAVLAAAGNAAVPRIAPPATITVHLQFVPATPQFGDRIEAKLVIAVNRRSVRPQTLRYSYGLAPLTALGAAQESQLVHGDLELVRVVVPVTCVTEPCVARKGVATLTFPNVRATVTKTNGARERVWARWPALAVHGRVLASALAGAAPAFEANTVPTPPSYGVPPAMLATLLDILAAACAAGAVALAASQAVVLARRRVPARRIDALARALRLTREAQRLPVAQRRQALGLLARALGPHRLSSTASELAWSLHKPEPDELEVLVSEIERERLG